MVGIKIIKDMLRYRHNIIALKDIDLFVTDLDTAIEELSFAFSGGQRELDIKNVIKIINYACNNSIGLGEAFSNVAREYKFPFLDKSLLSRKILINELNGSLEKIEKTEGFELKNLLGALFRDQVEVDKNEEIYNIGQFFRAESG